MNAVELALSRAVALRLRSLFEAALAMPAGARVVDHVGPTPWGEIDAFVEEVLDPLNGEPQSTEQAGSITLRVSSGEVSPSKTVLAALSESVAGGVPWIEMTGDERTAIAQTLNRLDGELKKPRD